MSVVLYFISKQVSLHKLNPLTELGESLRTWTPLNLMSQIVANTTGGSVKGFGLNPLSDLSYVQFKKDEILRDDLKDKNLKFSYSNFPLDKKILSTAISGNVGKTIRVFTLLGLNIEKSEKFNSIKSLVGSVVDKRNNIIHHNDSSAETSLNDILTYIDDFIKYISNLIRVITFFVLRAFFSFALLQLD